MSKSNKVRYNATDEYIRTKKHSIDRLVNLNLKLCSIMQRNVDLLRKRSRRLVAHFMNRRFF